MRRSGGERDKGGCEARKQAWKGWDGGPPLAGLRGDREVCPVAGTEGNERVAMWVLSLWLVAERGRRGMQ